MEPDAELAKAQVAKGCLRPFDKSKTFGSDFDAVRQARGQAGRGRAIPGGEAGPAREFTNLSFVEAHVKQRSQDMMLCGRAVAWAEVGCIVGVNAVRDGGDVSFCGKFIEDFEEFVFAEIASIACVGAVRGIVHFVGFNELVVNRELLEERRELIAIVSRIAGRNCCDGKSAVAESFVRGPSEISGVRATGKRNDEGRKCREIRKELRFLFRSGKGRRLARTNFDHTTHGKSITQ